VALAAGGGAAYYLAGAVVTSLAGLAAAAAVAMMAIAMGVQSDDLRLRALGIMAGAAGALAYWLSLPVARDASSAGWPG
jgi:hypothetical protein